MDVLEISGKKNENIKCFEQSLFYQGEQNGIQSGFEKGFEENLCDREEKEGVFKEIFCPVHGRQLIKIYDFNNQISNIRAKNFYDEFTIHNKKYFLNKNNN